MLRVPTLPGGTFTAARTWRVLKGHCVCGTTTARGQRRAAGKSDAKRRTPNGRRLKFASNLKCTLVTSGVDGKTLVRLAWAVTSVGKLRGLATAHKQTQHCSPHKVGGDHQQVAARGMLGRRI